MARLVALAAFLEAASIDIVSGQAAAPVLQQVQTPFRHLQNSILGASSQSEASCTPVSAVKYVSRHELKLMPSTCPVLHPSPDFATQT